MLLPAMWSFLTRIEIPTVSLTAECKFTRSPFLITVTCKVQYNHTNEMIEDARNLLKILQRIQRAVEVQIHAKNIVHK